MDWRNDESDYSSVENILWDEKSPLSRTKSNVSLLGSFGYNVCSQAANLGTWKESRSLTSVFERLEVEGKDDLRNEESLAYKTCDTQTDSCDDFEHDSPPGYRTRETVTFRCDNHDFNILNFQGVRHSPADIARCWKKDSRMWLWKCVKRMRKKTKTDVLGYPIIENHDQPKD